MSDKSYNVQMYDKTSKDKIKMYPYTNAKNVLLDKTDNASLPENIDNMEDVTNALGSMAFIDDSILDNVITYKDTNDTNTEEIDDSGVSYNKAQVNDLLKDKVSISDISDLLNDDNINHVASSKSVKTLNDTKIDKSKITDSLVTTQDGFVASSKSVKTISDKLTALDNKTQKISSDNDSSFVALTPTDAAKNLISGCSISARKVNNRVDMYITGTYKGVPATGTQNLGINIPQKYRPKFSIYFPGMAYQSSSPYVTMSRIAINTDGSLLIAETSMANGAQIRIFSSYFID